MKVAVQVRHPVLQDAFLLLGHYPIRGGDCPRDVAEQMQNLKKTKKHDYCTSYVLQLFHHKTYNDQLGLQETR